MISLSSLILFIVIPISLFAAPQADLVKSLPGFDESFESPQYAGYISPNPTDHYYYWFSAAHTDKPTSLPVVIFMNGGPGCSSLGGGFFSESGDVHVDKHEDGKFKVWKNEYSWGKFANQLFFEQPIGVGFSWSSSKEKYSTNDTETARRNLEVVVKWYEMFPEYLDSPLYIMGESYAGIYIPTLVNDILLHNQNTKGPKINLKGFSTGNPITSWDFDTRGMLDSIFYDSLMSKQAIDTAYKKCNGNFYNNTISECNTLVDNTYSNFYDINPYYVDNLCDPKNPHPVNQVEQLMKHSRPKTFNAMRNAIVGDEIKDNNYLCNVDTWISQYLNQPDVRPAIHAGNVSVTGAWALCSSKVDYKITLSTVVPIYQRWWNELNIVMVSGVRDTIVPWPGSQAILDHYFGPHPEWKRWSYQDDNYDKTGGFYTTYRKSATGSLSFATVLSAGHMIPEFAPKRAFHFAQNFISGSYATDNFGQ